MKRIIIVAVATWFLALPGPTQPPTRRHVDPAKPQKEVIQLPSRTFLPAAGVEAGLEEHLAALERERYDRIHLVAQFADIPDAAARKRLEERKIRLLDPIPERAYYVSLPPNRALLRELVAGKHVRWIGKIEPNDKIAPSVRDKKIPPHALRKDNKAALIVEFFGDVPESAQRNLLRQQGAEIVNRVVALNGWHVVVAVDKIPRYVVLDPVKWIVEAPPPPEDDNDGVRSATGVNSDPLSVPATYNLSGAGVFVGHWEGTHATSTHDDYRTRLVVGDPPISAFERSAMHHESVAVNGRYDVGEGIYYDMDDSGIVSPGDLRCTALGALPAGSVVAAGEADIGTNLVAFRQFVDYVNPYEAFTDDVTADYIYTAGEGIYLDNDFNSQVSAGDTRITAVGVYAAGSTVSAGPPNDTDIDRLLWSFAFQPHYHASHVAGTLIGDGTRSAANGGTPNQWRGVAAGATIRSYSGNPITGASPSAIDEYADAATNGVSLSSNSWGYGHYYQITTPNSYYDVGSQYYDAIVSGRRSDGTAAGLTRSVLIVASAGNKGNACERYVDNNPANGRYDAAEAVYRDADFTGTVTASDTLLRGAVEPVGTALANFSSDVMHDETLSTTGTFNAGEGIYIDTDASRTVTAGDTRIVAPAGSGFADGSVVAAGNADIGRLLKWFRPYGSIRIPNSAKNTVVVANIASDTKNLSVTSSRGPSFDGRFKPDVAAPGWQSMGDMGVTSTWPGNGYDTITGTSMSTPAVSGCAALIEEWYKSAVNSTGPSTQLMRALLIHGVEDLTSIPQVGTGYLGPDFAFGYGRIRAQESADLTPHFLRGTAAAVGSTDYTATIGAMPQLKVTLVWNDPPSTASTPPSTVTGLLRNDLDLLVIGPDGRQHTPWIADPANLFAPALRSTVPSGSPVPAAAIDHRNTVEQVLVDSPGAGVWTIRVTASTLTLPPQEYVLVSEALPPNASVCTLPAADIWIKDNPTEDGSVPSSGAMYLGPDVWNRLAADGVTAHENPEFGQTNYLYANLRNLSGVTVKSAVIDAWISTLAIGLVWPDGFVHVGRFNVQNLGPGEVRQVGPVAWSPQETGHHCMYARASSPQDPITFTETSSVWTNAQNSNNIAYHNMMIVDLSSEKSVSFLVRNPRKEAATLDIAFDIPPALLEKGEVRMMLSPRLEKAWTKEHRRDEGFAIVKYRTLDPQEPQTGTERKATGAKAAVPVRVPIYRITANKPVIRGMRLGPRQEEQMMLTFASNETAKTVTEVHVTQSTDGKAQDGIVFIVKTGHRKPVK